MQKPSFIFVVLLWFLIGCSDSLDVYEESETAAPAVSLNVKMAPQQTEVWCWAAVIEMISDYYGNTAYQCQTLSWWFNGADCCSFPSFCAVAGTDHQIQQSLFTLGISSEFQYSPLTWSQVKREIDARRPFIIFYQGSFIGHVVVVYGYEQTTNSLLIHDPYFGTFKVPFGSTFTYNGSMFWSRTLLRIKT